MRFHSYFYHSIGPFHCIVHGCLVFAVLRREPLTFSELHLSRSPQSVSFSLHPRLQLWILLFFLLVHTRLHNVTTYDSKQQPVFRFVRLLAWVLLQSAMSQVVQMQELHVHLMALMTLLFVASMAVVLAVYFRLETDPFHTFVFVCVAAVALVGFVLGSWCTLAPVMRDAQQKGCVAHALEMTGVQEETNLGELSGGIKTQRRVLREQPAVCSQATRVCSHTHRQYGRKGSCF